MKRKRNPTDIARKVSAASLGAALAGVIFWLIPGNEPESVQGAVTLLATFGFGYLVSEE